MLFSEKPRTPSPLLKQEDYIDVWKEQRPSPEAAVIILKKHNSPVTCAQFSNDGMKIVSCAGDCEIIVSIFISWPGFVKEENSGYFSGCVGYTLFYMIEKRLVSTVLRAFKDTTAT